MPLAQPTPKRKALEDPTPPANAPKRAKKETKPSTSNNKRKLINAEELPGGLMIIRAPNSRPPSAQGNHSLPQNLIQQPLPPRPPSSQTHRLLSTTAGPSKPPSKKFRADNGPHQAPTPAIAHQANKSKDRDILPSFREEPEVEEDVRRMDSEADDLRRLSRAHDLSSSSSSVLDPEFKFPSSSSDPKQHRRRQQPSVTPRAMEKSRAKREGQHQRRSSMGMRGKRISTSFETTGVISHPHNSVSDSSFYKHIDPDLPAASRARQLLIWCSSRAIAKVSEPASSSKRKAKHVGKDPPLSEKAAKVLKKVQEDVIKMLAEKKVDTNVFSGPDAPVEKKIKENAQNVRNRECQARFTAQIERAEVEDRAWAETDRFYAARLAELVDLGQPSSSSKAKGKQRADSDDSTPHIDELPERFRGGASMALELLAEDPSQKTPLTQQLDDLEFELDSLHAFANLALQCTNVAESDLDHRFALLSYSLASRTPSTLPFIHSASSPALSSYLPVSLSRPEPTTDPQDLLRAITRVDVERPPAQVGDAARRAVREVQRANETGGVSERRLTGVPPPTPRKVPGTPRKNTTPSRNR